MNMALVVVVKCFALIYIFDNQSLIPPGGNNFLQKLLLKGIKIGKKRPGLAHFWKIYFSGADQLTNPPTWWILP